MNKLFSSFRNYKWQKLFIFLVCFSNIYCSALLCVLLLFCLFLHIAWLADLSIFLDAYNIGGMAMGMGNGRGGGEVHIV